MGRKIFGNAGFMRVSGSRKLFLGNGIWDDGMPAFDGFGFWACFWERRKDAEMIKKNYKGRCQKRKMKKCKDVVRTYSNIQSAYAEVLEREEKIKEFRCNVFLDGLEAGAYSSDFVCVKQDGELMVRECVERKHLMKPMTVRLLDASREYWRRNGVTDWGLVINEEK